MLKLYCLFGRITLVILKFLSKTNKLTKEKIQKYDFQNNFILLKFKFNTVKYFLFYLNVSQYLVGPFDLRHWCSYRNAKMLVYGISLHNTQSSCLL